MKKSVKNFSLVMGMAVAMQLSIACLPVIANAAEWREGVSYKVGEVVTYNGTNYECLAGHTAWVGANWNPRDTTTLWKVTEKNESTPTGQTTTPSTSQKESKVKGEYTSKIGETYNVGDMVRYNGKEYICKTTHTYHGDPSWLPGGAGNLWMLASEGNNTPITQPTEPTTTPIWQPTQPTTPTTTPIWQPTQPTTPTLPVELVAAKGKWGEKVFAPYVDVTLYPLTSIGTYMDLTGNKYYTLAFITSKNGGTPAWGGAIDYNQNTTDPWEPITYIRDGIKRVREAGGDVIVSFGGATGTELAMDIKDVTKLQQTYQKVIDEYKLTWVDFDIEGAAVSDRPSIQRRNQAIAALQKANPNLTIGYCLPVLPEGLTADGIYVLQDAKEKGVKIDVVNIMTMDYGPAYTKDMGDYAIEAAKNTEAKIREIGLNAKIGNTPMIGVNDVANNVFQLEDAKQLLEWGKTNDSVRLLSMWSITRDHAKGTGLYNYTMIPQNEYDFTNIFKEFNNLNNK